MITTHFSDIEKIIIENICAAETEIKIAVAWFNNSNIFDRLIAQLPNNTVSLLISNDKNNYDNGLDFSKLITAGGKIFLYSDNKLMHNKYLIIDNKTVITGSYNLTFGAEYLNKENVVVFKDELSIAKQFSDNFNVLIQSSKEVVDFNSEINKTEDLINNVVEQAILEGDFKIDKYSIPDDLEETAHAIVEQYNLGNLTTRGRAILSLVEEKLSATDNQKILIAAYITYMATGETALAENCLKKIKGKDIKRFKNFVSLLLKYKVNLTM